MPGQDTVALYKLTAICILSDFIPACVNPLYYTYTLTKHMKVPCYITLSMGIANIVSMYLLLKLSSMGGYAIVITTMMINWVHFWDSPIYAAYCLHKNWKTFYPVIFLHLSGGVIQVIISLLLRSVYPKAVSWSSLIVKIILFGIIGGCVCVITNTTKKERRILMSRLDIGRK